MPDTARSTEASTAEAQLDVAPAGDSTPDANPESGGDAADSSTDRRVRYCPKCHARYLKAAGECDSCAVKLVNEQPRDISLFRPKLDLPFVLAFVLFTWGYDRLTGEAQSFGLIFLIVGFATLVTFRAISYVEWLGRR